MLFFFCEMKSHCVAGAVVGMLSNTMHYWILLAIIVRGMIIHDFTMNIHFIFHLVLHDYLSLLLLADPCDYTCTTGGGCSVLYKGPHRTGPISGSCFSDSFGGSCSGTPPECQDCNKAVTCRQEELGGDPEVKPASGCFAICLFSD